MCALSFSVSLSLSLSLSQSLTVVDIPESETYGEVTEQRVRCHWVPVLLHPSHYNTLYTTLPTQYPVPI